MNGAAPGNYPTVRVAVLDVGQGDTTIVTVPSSREALVVDCINASATLDYLQQEGITRLRALLITHLHADHYREAALFLRGCSENLGLECERLFMHSPSSRLSAEVFADDHSGSAEFTAGVPRPAKRAAKMHALLQWRVENSARCKWHNAGENLATVDSSSPLSRAIRVIHPHQPTYEALATGGLNNTSSVLMVQGKGTRMLLPGDIEPRGWQALLESGPNDLRADVLKLPHHGGWLDASFVPVLETVQPAIAVASVGTEQAGYNHPSPHVFDALATHGVTLFCTQVTRKCCANPNEEQIDVHSKLSRHADELGVAPLLHQRGCPCAGTVVVELGAAARVIQPQHGFHRPQIVRANYLARHRCLC